MAELTYKQKYIKYKNKYNGLKNILTNNKPNDNTSSVPDIYELSDTPDLNMLGGSIAADYNLTDTPNHEEHIVSKEQVGGDIDVSGGNFTPMPPAPCPGVVNPVVITPSIISSKEQMGGDIDVSGGNFTPMVPGACPGVVNPVVMTPSIISSKEQVGGEVVGESGYSSALLIEAAPYVAPSGIVSSVGPVPPVATYSKTLFVNNAELDNKSDNLSDIRNTADIEELFTQLGGKNINKEYYSSSSSSETSSSSLFSSSDSFSDSDLQEY